MRTRFLATEHSSVATPVQTVDFLRLTLPRLPPPDDISFSADFLHSFDGIPVFCISLEIDKFLIDDALSIFLSDVLPQFINAVDFEEQNIDSSKENFEKSTEIRFGEKESDNLTSDKTEVKHGTTTIIKSRNAIEFVQFEIPEMNISLPPMKSDIHSQMENLCIFSEISAAERTMDLLHTELRLHDHLGIQQSVYSVDNMSMEYSMEQKADLLEDDGSIQGQLHSPNIKFPLFEVDVESLSMLGGICLYDEFLCFFEDIETQQLMKLGVISNNKELLGSMEFDLMKYVSQDFFAMQYLEDTHFSPQVDHLSILELSPFQEYSTFHRGKPDDSICSMNPILFDEFHFFDLDSYHLYEVFTDAAKGIEAECESIFGEAMNFRSFSELITCHELTLMDDSFKSLPVPIFSDHGNTSSLLLFIEEILAKLDRQSSSASDGLYLDWHFFEEDDCDLVKYSSCWKILWEIDTCNTDSSLNLNDSGKLVFDFILSEDHSNKPSAENYKEMLDIPFSDVSLCSTLPSSSGKLGNNSLRNPGNERRISEELSVKTGVEKIPLFGKSMTSDLEFFLNPIHYNTERENVPADKLVDTNTMSQVLKSNDDYVTANATTVVQQQSNNILQQKGNLDSTSAQKERKTKSEELSNAMPVKETHDSEPLEVVGEDNTCTMMPGQSIQAGLEAKQVFSCKPFFPDTVIIVNTRNFTEEMVISRRSTYQRILEMEKEGAQVIERDIGLPIDLVVSAAVCLTWYDHKNIGKKASAPDEAFSCLPLCVESIAASILTSLSFAFGCCILIFEGEGNFLGSIMESSDELYAAAASLGIDVQLFCSYSSEMTEEIILSCINAASKLSRGLYPKMPDSESLAESFLTAFPSINPLSAHAILSLDAMLGTFMELSNESRIFALQKFQVPEESVALLSSICRYGEREDSKSGMTECSSPVSSVLESENIQFKSASERKKPKYSHSLYNAGELPNDFFCLESLKLLPDDQFNPPKFSVSRNSVLQESDEIFDELGKFNLSFDDKVIGHSLAFDSDMMKKSSDKSKPYNFQVAKGREISDEREVWMTQLDVDCAPRRRSATAATNGISRQSAKVSGNSQDSFIGEVIDVEKKFSAENLGSSSPFLLDVEKDYAARNSRRIQVSMGANNLHLFSNPVQNDSSSDVWTSRKNGQILREEINPHFNSINSNNISTKCQKGPLEEDMIVETPHNCYREPFQENYTRSYGDTPLSKALHSTQLQKGSPWTIEFLNRIREKSRLRKQSLSHNLSSPCFDSSVNTSKAIKRKSPSILEFFKYEGGSTSKKVGEQKRQKRVSQPPKSMKNEKNSSASCPPSWTPADKRARRMLSFATKGSGGQTKLVWTDNNSHNAKRKI